ncbi:T3SS effector HopA1 family protein [Staphylococcus caprae]|uniref:T3SS effector HopA1 family protein n=1 Tax=Staphylococcus caprae TaxID=29380 RepID=UPI0005C90453|nr:T3SS effector HopA1 family protein [Staphylococcus caprae]
MTEKVNTLEDLALKIELETDLNRVKIDNETYDDVLENQKSKLKQWLYSMLHTGNLNNQVKQTTKTFNDLTQQIVSRIKDPGIRVETSTQSFNGHTYHVIQGLRINEEVNEDNSLVIPCSRPNLTPGFFMFVHKNNGLHMNKVTRHYIYADTPQYAIELWSQCVNELVEKNVSFSAKVLSSSDSYPRNDALVFYSSEDKEKVEKVLIEHIESSPIKIKKGSQLASQLRYNLYTAEEPIQINGIQQSFGEHRCSAIADAIQDYFNTGAAFQLLLKQRLIANQIDIKDLSKNAVQ